MSASSRKDKIRKDIKVERFCNNPSCDLCDVMIRKDQVLFHGGKELCPKCFEELIVREKEKTPVLLRSSVSRGKKKAGIIISIIFALLILIPDHLCSEENIQITEELINVEELLKDSGTTGKFVSRSYLVKIKEKINKSWNPPKVVSNPKFSGQAMVGFRITRTGEVKDITVEKSSGDFNFDRVAIKTVRDSHPLPRLPEEYPESSLFVHLTFNISKPVIEKKPLPPPQIKAAARVFGPPMVINPPPNQYRNLKGRSIWAKRIKLELFEKDNLKDEFNRFRQIDILEKFTILEIIDIDKKYRDKGVDGTLAVQVKEFASTKNLYFFIRNTEELGNLFFLEEPEKIYPRWPKVIWIMIKQRAIFLGMTQDQVLLSWGGPSKKEIEGQPKEFKEIWIYEGKARLFFEEGVLISWEN